MSSNTLTTSFGEKITVLLMLLFVNIFGSVGNAIVVWVYCRRRDNQTATFFIIVLAAADLLVCLLVTPFTMAMEWMAFSTNSEVLCKTYYFFNTSNPLFCSLLISAVALDRYFCICHPMREILSVKRAQILVASLAAFSFLMGVSSAMNVEVVATTHTINRDLPPQERSNNPQLPLWAVQTLNVSELELSLYETATVHPGLDYLCEEINYTGNITLAQQLFYEIIQKVNNFCFLFCIVVVIICYSFVYRVVLKLRRNNRSLTVSKTSKSPLCIANRERVRVYSINPPSSDTEDCIDNEKREFITNYSPPPCATELLPPPPSSSHASRTHFQLPELRRKNQLSSSAFPTCGRQNRSSRLSIDVDNNHRINSKPRLSFASQSEIRNSSSGSTLPRRSRFHFKRLLSDCRYVESLQNLRSAAMLFVVAVVYILVFTPAILMASNIIPMNIVIFNLYYLNNVSNPIIYCFMNGGFREQLRRILFQKYFAYS